MTRTKKPNKRKRRTKRVTSSPDHLFKKGNKWWAKRTKYGQNKKFKTPAILFKACQEYFEFAEKNPLYELKVVGTYYGEAVTERLPKLRPMTIGSLCLFLDIGHDTWIGYRKQEAYSKVCEAVETVIREQKFAGAAVGLFNHAIIARDLGLVDKQDMTTKGEPIQNQTVVVLPAKKSL